MSHKIDPSVIAATGAATPIRGVDRGRSHSTPAAAKSESRDRIELTGDAQSLQALETRVRSESGVDSAKVAEVRRQLAEGRYNPNPAAIAASLVQSEIGLK
jgi:flagellar biosynthesis anti-sigma factor FlgM